MRKVGREGKRRTHWRIQGRIHGVVVGCWLELPPLSCNCRQWAKIMWLEEEEKKDLCDFVLDIDKEAVEKNWIERERYKREYEEMPPKARSEREKEREQANRRTNCHYKVTETQPQSITQ